MTEQPPEAPVQQRTPVNYPDLGELLRRSARGIDKPLTGFLADMKARGLLDEFDRTETGDLLVLTSKGQQEAIIGLERASESVPKCACDGARRLSRRPLRTGLFVKQLAREVSADIDPPPNLARCRRR